LSSLGFFPKQRHPKDRDASFLFKPGPRPLAQKSFRNRNDLLLQRYWCEWIAISKESLVCGRRGFLAPRPKSIPVAAVSEIKIGHHYEPGDSESYESSVTLNVFYLTPKGRKSRHMVGYWLHPTLKEKVFCDIQEFAEKHEIPLTFRRN